MMYRSVGIAVFSLALLAGCGNGGSSSSGPTGMYQSKMGPDQSFSLNFLGTNEIEATFSEGGHARSYKTNYVTSGDTIVMNMPESERHSGAPDSLTLERNGEALELNMQGMTIRFEKL